MSNTTYYNPNSELCLEVRQWLLDNPILKTDTTDHEPSDSDLSWSGFYGKKHTAESNRANALAHTGIKHSPETIAKRMASLKGRPYEPHTEETKKKISLSLTGKKQSPETIEKRASKLRGKKRTPEQKENLRKGWVKRRLAEKIFKC